jgi:hypothetical protein
VEIKRLFNTFITQPILDLHPGCAGRSADADTSITPAPATTAADGLSRHEHHQVRLPY